MWGGNTEIEENKIQIGVLEDAIIDLDKEINNHKGNMIGNLIWIIVCILLLIFVNIYITNKNVIISNNVISIILLIGNLIMIIVNKNKRDTTEFKKMGKISRMDLLIKQNNVLQHKELAAEEANKLASNLLKHQELAAEQRKKVLQDAERYKSDPEQW
jgi:hypothetical protein